MSQCKCNYEWRMTDDEWFQITNQRETLNLKR